MTTLLAFINNRAVRDAFWQAVVAISVAGLLVYFVRNASDNMVKAGIASGFDFLGRTSGIDVPFVLTGYVPQSSIAALLWVGVVNTMLVAAVSIVLATILGFFIGLARLSSNWLLSTLAGAYVEFVRNIPLLFFVLFWYSVVIGALPQPRESLSIFSIAFLNNRGLTIPVATDGTALRWAALVAVLSLLLQVALALYAARRRRLTGRSLPIGSIALVTALLIPLAAFGIAAAQTPWEIPALRGFNYRGGFVLVPEFVALLGSLATYTAGFIAEVVRGGIQAVPKGQIEAARALGLSSGQTLRLVTVPLALRVVIPPLTSQYLNVLKNSSFGAAIAYPEIVSLFMGSALNATGQAIEIIAITLAIYLGMGLLVSLFMAWFNARMTLVTR
ncbi:MAG: ABC transporter permease subunit [Hyphomicrobiales bacterium]|nr:MAG: ABC transporter permease subunit [Hyphomicrobiales bacterium]